MEYVVKIPMDKVERGHLLVNRNFEELFYIFMAGNKLYIYSDRFHKM